MLVTGIQLQFGYPAKLDDDNLFVAICKNKALPFDCCSDASVEEATAHDQEQRVGLSVTKEEKRSK